MNSLNCHTVSTDHHASQAGTLTVYTNTAHTPDAVEQPKDRVLAASILKALHELQESFDAAALAGLIIEPSFKLLPNRFHDRGSDAETYVARVEVYRKLA